MEHSISPEITYHHEPLSKDDFKKRIGKTAVLLSVITLIELGLGLLMYSVHLPHFVVLGIKGIITILTLAKAFYIVSIFMHLGDEIRNMAMTVVVPLMLFIWFIAAFLWDGNSFRTLRNKYDTSFKERTAVEKGQHTEIPPPAPGIKD